jgi:hypothetical protein
LSGLPNQSISGFSIFDKQTDHNPTVIRLPRRSKEQARTAAVQSPYPPNSSARSRLVYGDRDGLRAAIHPPCPSPRLLEILTDGREPGRGNSCMTRAFFCQSGRQFNGNGLGWSGLRVQHGFSSSPDLFFVSATRGTDKLYRGLTHKEGSSPLRDQKSSWGRLRTFTSTTNQRSTHLYCIRLYIRGKIQPSSEKSPTRVHEKSFSSDSQVVVWAYTVPGDGWRFEV